MPSHAISWFEIPSTDLSRAQRFYETIFGVQLTPLDLPNLKMRMFPGDQESVSGAVVYEPGSYQPSATHGPVIYLNGNPDLQRVLDKVEAAGGKILLPKTQITPEYGYMGLFLDTEGNRIGLHSAPEQ